MIVVDSSVWIANLRDAGSEPVRKLKAIEIPSDILVGDLVLLEVLQGARNDRHASLIEGHLRQFQIARMLDERLALQAAGYFRLLRQRGITIRKTVDVIIATFCIAGGHTLLHDDRDFAPFTEHFGLRTL